MILGCVVASEKMGVGSGVGLTLADMVGTGVLTTAGFMALDLTPRQILLDWLLGGLIALAGATAYGALARLVPRSGGEYRYLSELWHPGLGYLAGWTSLLVGFSVPVALAALAAGAFAEAVLPGIDARLVAAVLIVLVSLAHAIDLETSKRTQDALAATKAVLIALFIAIGLLFGNNTLPPAPAAGEADFPVGPFFTSLIYITFCYSGWNAATYASEEFENPRRDVPRSMLIGCALVVVIYLLVNWVFVTNLSSEDMTGWIKGDTDRITLAHLVMTNLLGEGAATIMSLVVILALLSAISAMTLIGPRVYAAMADDGFLPSALAARAGHPPAGSVILQSSLAVILVFFSGFREMLNNVGSILALVSAATVLSLFRVRATEASQAPGLLARACAIVYAAMAAWMVYFAVQSSATVELAGVSVPTVILWMLGIAVAAGAGFYATRALRQP